MLFSLTGASGVGKSTVLAHLDGVTWPEPVRCVEFDSIGVPDGADTAWRHGAVEHWVQQALQAQAAGEHMLLCGQVPMGELLAAPSADSLDDIAVCMLHCSPEVRTERLQARGEDPAAIVHHNRFGEWFRGHTLDPRHAPEVIRVESGVPMAWERWAEWERGDARWAAEIIDTDGLASEEVAGVVEEWVRRTLAVRSRG
ncbi:AAA family ATPase [Microbacterium sp. EST19A]|uniref:AAA family ATPase n=1 Tax=Microbacterium sp. EST19A TaxID=2862681 RepID=UPI001CBCC3CD|nr:AAA family ATPase [Microbacterium sp. EST19A]